MSLAVLRASEDLQVVFEVTADKVRTWQELRRSAAARWATHEVYGGKPVKEFLGPGLDKISLLVRLDMERGVVPIDEINTMREMMNTGSISQFTVGGELIGDFTVDVVDDDWHRVWRDGVLVTAIVALTLEEYH